MKMNFTARQAGLTALLALTLFCAVIYANTLNVPFVFDDLPNIVENSNIHLTAVDAEKLFSAAFKGSPSRRPVANLTFALNYYFHQLDVKGFHVINILIHLANGILVYILSLKTLSRWEDTAGQIPWLPTSRYPWFSLFAALFFIGHPLQTQSVTYIVQRMNSMAVMFYLLALILYIYGRLNTSPLRRRRLYLAAFGAWVLALGSKQTAATFPVVVFFYEWYFFQGLNKEWLKKNIKLLVVLGCVFALIGWAYFGGQPLTQILGSYKLRDFTLQQRVLTQPRVIMVYLTLLFFPHPARLNLLHHIAPSNSLFDPVTTFFSLIFILGLMGLGVATARKQPLISFSIFWFFIHLVIESSLVGLELIFEHRLYLPMFGIAIPASCLLFFLFSKRKSWAMVIALSIVLLLGWGTYSRNRVWQNHITLWSDVIEKNPYSHRGHYNLGAYLILEGKLEAAVVHYLEAIRLKPDYDRAYNNLGVVFELQGKLAEALARYSEAVRIKPDFAIAHYNRGVIFEKQGRLKAAVESYLEALRISPDFGEAYNNLGIVLAGEGKLEAAVQSYLGALRTRSDNAEGYNNLGVALEGQGRLEEAAHSYLEALRIRPDYTEALNNLGVARTRQGRFQEAVVLFESALRIKPDDAGAHNNLGVTLARQGLQKEAMAHYSKALQIKPDYTEAQNNLGIALADMGRHPEAVAQFKDALRMRPGDEKTRRNLQYGLKLLNDTLENRAQGFKD
ncbi:MAG: tetratricopeptide repeat protein [Desulfobacterales bacterium]|nr:tetratricopeptide repeat protein [Desulfobacterales bacterium]